jgi:hypothetical protein
MFFLGMVTWKTNKKRRMYTSKMSPLQMQYWSKKIYNIIIIGKFYYFTVLLRTSVMSNILLLKQVILCYIKEKNII